MRARSVRALCLLALLLALALGLPRATGCANRRLGVSPAPAPSAPPPVSAAGAPAPATGPAPAPPGAGGAVTQAEPRPARAWARDEEGVIQVTLTDGAIGPAVITGQEFVPVKLLVVNRGRRPHNLVIPDFRLAGRILAPGEENYIQFTPDHTGDFPLFSDAPRPGAPEPGMTAVLRVR